MADVDDLCELLSGSKKSSSTCLQDQLVDSLSFGVDLGGENGIWVGRETISETIDGEGWELCQTGVCDVAVVARLATLARCSVSRPVCFC